MKNLWFIVLLSGISVNYCENVIDVDDILSKDFMPGTLLMLENPKNVSKSGNESLGDLPKTFEDSFSNAMETMGFHREKMNEYLCRNYIAEQIINKMTLSRIRRRMEVEDSKILGNNNLLEDQGSSNYKDWLSKSTTLEDIYRHYNSVENRVDDNGTEESKEGEMNEDYDGQVAGYAVQKQANANMAKLGQTGAGGYSHHFSGSGQGYPHSSYGGSGGGYTATGHGVGGTGHSGHGIIHEHEHIIHEHHPKYVHQEDSKKEHDLSDLFDIALTALAYLSFGLFIIHVIMCISMAGNKNMTTAMPMMMPMSMSPTSTGTGMGGGMTGTGADTPVTGGDMTGTGGGMTGTGGGGTTGTGGGSTGTGGGSTPTGGSTGAGAGATGTGGGSTGTGGGSTPTGGGSTGTGGGTTGTGGGSTGTGGGSTPTGGGSTGAGGGATGTGGGSTGTGGGSTPTGGGSTGTGGGSTPTGGGSTGAGGTGGGSTGTGGSDGGDGGTGGGGNTAPTSTGTDGTRDTLNFRWRRDIPTITNPNNRALNELARRILTSIDAATIAHEDQGNCLRKTLCENNKYSRTVKDNKKYFVPVLSLGLSWLSGRVTPDVNPATSLLDSLKASILGLGKANCEIIYQNCNLHLQKKESRRKKRNLKNKL